MSDASEACRIAAAKSARPDVDAMVPAANDAPHTVRQAERHTHAVWMKVAFAITSPPTP